MTSIKERTEIAKESKRDIPSVLKEIEVLATLSNEVALSCYYVVFDKQDNKPYIGISVRFAELIASCWSNIHTGAKIIKNNGMTVVVQGFVHDFEKNAIFTVEVERYIGKLSPERAIQATNAASSIAFRNAVFKAIPAAVTNTVSNNIKKHIVENIDGGSVIKDVLAYFKSKDITESDLSKLINNEIENITSEQLFLLIGLKNAIEEGDTTIAEVFKKSEAPKVHRSSKFDFSSNEEPKENIVDFKIGTRGKGTSSLNSKEEPSKKAFDGLVGGSETGETVASTKPNPKESIKNKLSELKETPKVDLPKEEVIGDVEEKEKPKKKRGRGRPSKNKS